MDWWTTIIDENGVRSRENGVRSRFRSRRSEAVSSKVEDGRTRVAPAPMCVAHRASVTPFGTRSCDCAARGTRRPPPAQARTRETCGSLSPTGAEAHLTPIPHLTSHEPPYVGMAHNRAVCRMEFRA